VEKFKHLKEKTMKLITKIKNLITKIKSKTNEVKLTITDFIQVHKEQIVQVMKLADLTYDNFKGSQKMKAVISFFITGLNTKCGTSFNAEQIGTDSTKQLEDKFQEVYNSLKA
jgi:hypothetical protein